LCRAISHRFSPERARSAHGHRLRMFLNVDPVANADGSSLILTRFGDHDHIDPRQHAPLSSVHRVQARGFPHSHVEAMRSQSSERGPMRPPARAGPAETPALRRARTKIDPQSRCHHPHHDTQPAMGCVNRCPCAAGSGFPVRGDRGGLAVAITEPRAEQSLSSSPRSSSHVVTGCVTWRVASCRRGTA